VDEGVRLIETLWGVKGGCGLRCLERVWVRRVLGGLCERTSLLSVIERLVAGERGGGKDVVGGRGWMYGKRIVGEGGVAGGGCE